MAQIVVRNLDDQVMDEFKALARRRGRSAEQQVRELIEREVQDAARWEEFRRLSQESLDDFAARGIRFDDSTALIREDRER